VCPFWLPKCKLVERKKGAQNWPQLDAVPSDTFGQQGCQSKHKERTGNEKWIWAESERSRVDWIGVGTFEWEGAGEGKQGKRKQNKTARDSCECELSASSLATGAADKVRAEPF